MQVWGLSGYTNGAQLALTSGRFEVEYGDDCADFLPAANVLVYPGTRGLAMLGLPDGSDPTCHVLIGRQLDAPSCLRSGDQCDVALEGGD